jgi:DNA-binding NtrC family response regulator
MTHGTILIIEDERTLGRAISLFLGEAGFEVVLMTDAESGLAAFERARPDVVFTDVRLPGMSGLELLPRLRALDPTVPVVIMTAHGTIEGAVLAVKDGAYDYLKKPVDLAEMKLLAERAMESARMKQELTFLRGRADRGASAGDIIGRAPAFQAVLERARQLAELDETPPVLITGETGTGKSLLARTIHVAGSRHERPFIDVNCTTLPATLAEAELFGHERGAFTDAKESRMGLFEAAEGGFLFLDEIGDLDIGIQGKLLKAIEDRVVRRLGGTRDRKVDVRIISATNRDLAREAERDRFRRDLFYRIAVMTLHMPALRERGDDVLLLADFYLARTAARYGRDVRALGQGAQRLLLEYSWPGNVRELSHVIERAVLWSRGAEVETDQLAAAIGPMRSAPPRPAATDEFPVAPMSLPAGTDLAQWERSMLESALRDEGGNQTRAAQRLGISRDTLRYRMKKYGIQGG